MLVIARKKDQAIILKAAETIPAGTEVRLVVTEVSGHYAHLGLDAPRSITITREELVGQPRKEGKPCPKPSE